MLNIILRSHSRGSIVNSNRIVSDDLTTLKFKCVASLFNSTIAARTLGLDVQLTMLDDHSSEDFLARVQAYSDKIGLGVELIQLEESGYNNSAYQQYVKAREAKYLVYIVEDDYFHAPEAILELWNSYHYFREFVPFGELGIFPYDCPDRYDINREYIQPTKLFYGNGRYWRTITQTTITAMYSADSIRRHFPIFEKLALEYPKVNESNTINLLYNNLVQYAGPITMFSPIPSLAIHMSYEKPITLTSSMNDWNSAWNNFEVSNDN